jgi:MFS family permease
MSFTSARRWRHDLGLVATGRAVSLLGDEAVLVALLLRTSHSSSSVADAGLAVAGILLAALLPALLLAPVAGLAVDRLRTKPLVISLSVGQAVACVGLAFTDALLPVLLLVAALNAAQAVVGPAWQTLVPTVVPQERVPSALATVQTVVAAATVVAPALGGLLVAAGGTALACLANATSFLVLAGCAALLSRQRVPSPRPETGERPSAVAESLAGFRLVGTDKAMLALFALLGLFVLALGAVNVAEVFFITQVLGAGPLVYGLVGVAFAGGLLVGTTLSRTARDDAGLARLIVLAVTVMTVSMLAIGLSPNVPAVALASAAVGVGNGMLNVRAQQLVVSRTPRALLGRVFAALTAVANGGAVAALAVGAVLLGSLGARGVFVAAACASGIAVTLAARPLLRTTRAPRPCPATAETTAAA